MTSDPGSAWLPLALPADAQSFRAASEAVAATLAAAGGTRVDAGPDVEVGGRPRGDAAAAIVPLAMAVPLAGGRTRRVAIRSLRWLALQPRARLAAARLRRLGYRETAVVPWELEWSYPLPLGALVLGRRSGGPTVLQAALAAAELPPGRTFVREGAAVVVTDTGVLRVAVGPSRTLSGQAAALDALRAAGPSASLAERIPWIERTGRAGLGDWTRERRLPGDPPAAVAGALADEALAVLADLRALESPASGRGPRGDAAIVAERAGAAGGRLHELGAQLERRLEGLPRCFGHGDFHAGNLLVQGSRVTGVVDWDAAAPGRLPLLDFLHLRANEVMRARGLHLGPVVLAQLLPWARAGGDEQSRRLVDVDAETLEQLVLAYWLDFVARDLEKSSDRGERRDWLATNVRLVAETVA